MNNSIIKKIRIDLKKNKFDGYLVTNNDIHLNENTNLFLKPVFQVIGFDSSFCYLIILQKKIALFTDGRYLVQAKKQFTKKNIEIYEYNIKNINLFLNNNFKYGSILGVDSNRISLNKFKEFKKNIFLSSSTLLPYKNNFFSSKISSFPPFNKSLPFSLPKTHTPRSFDRNINLIRSKLKSDAILIWDNSQIGYLLNIRSFELDNSTKPFAGLLITKKGKNILISDNPFIKNISKFNKNFKIVTHNDFLYDLKLLRIKKIETDYNKINLDIFQNIRFSNIDIIETKIELSQYISIKQPNEINNIKKAQFEDGLAVTKFLLYLKNNNMNMHSEFSLSQILLNFRKERINFFRNSFDYISAFDANAAKIHYKPLKNDNLKGINRSMYLIDSGGHYLEGTTDITRVIAIKKIPVSIQNIYTHILNALIDIESKNFKYPLIALKIDYEVRNKLAFNNIHYSHGTGHGVGFFNDVHERPPIISPKSIDFIKNNQFFSIEPGFYVENKYGLRIENLYLSKLKNSKITLNNTTLVPYDLQMINFKLLTKKNTNFIRNYHIDIHNKYMSYFTEDEKKIFKKYFLIN